MSVLERLTTIFAPDDCLHCGREGSLLCAACRPVLPAPIGRCFGCHQTIPAIGCSGCLSQSGLTSLAAACSYGGVAKLLVATLKFRGNQSAARHMAQAMFTSATLPGDALLVHMPATTSHVRERGFDQSKLIVKHLSRLSGLPRADVLRRHGQHHQLGSDRALRLDQLRSSLHVTRPANVTGKNIILIDDVLTTGSSLTVAAQCLLKAGARRVDGLVFAQSLQIKKPKP